MFQNLTHKVLWPLFLGVLLHFALSVLFLLVVEYYGLNINKGEEYWTNMTFKGVKDRINSYGIRNTPDLIKSSDYHFEILDKEGLQKLSIISLDKKHLMFYTIYRDSNIIKIRYNYCMKIDFNGKEFEDQKNSYSVNGFRTSFITNYKIQNFFENTFEKGLFIPIHKKVLNGCLKHYYECFFSKAMFEFLFIVFVIFIAMCVRITKELQAYD